MSSIIAFIVTILFISIALLIDRKKSDVSFAFWIPSIWVMYSSSRPIGYWLNPHLLTMSTADIDPTAGSPIDRLFLSILIVMGMVILLKRKVGFLVIINNNRLIFLLFYYMLVSILWSDYMVVSSKRWVRVTGDLVMVLIIITETDSVQAIITLLRRCAIVLIPLSVLFIKYFRHLGVGYDHLGRESWIGVTTNKNQLGQLCFIVGVFFLWILITKYYKRQLLKDKTQLFTDILLLIVALWILAGSVDAMSATALSLTILSAFCFIILLKLKSKRERVIVIISFFSLIVFSELLVNLILNKGLIEIIILSLGRDSSLTGRTEIWNDIMEIAAKNPLFGTGYGAFWIGNLTHNLWDKYYFQLKSAHNGYLDIYLELGAVGLFFLLVLIFVTFKNILETLSIRFEFGIFKLTLLITFCLYNISESQFLVPTSLLSFIFLLIAVNLPKRLKSYPEFSYIPKSYNSQ